MAALACFSDNIVWFSCPNQATGTGDVTVEGGM